MVPRHKKRIGKEKRRSATPQSAPLLPAQLTPDAYLVTTKLAKIRRASLLIPTESAFVRSVFHNIGRDGAPYWSHAYVPWKTTLMTGFTSGFWGMGRQWWEGGRAVLLRGLICLSMRIFDAER
jgi:hypothetical protein